MKGFWISGLLSLAVVAHGLPALAQQKSILFDAAHDQTAGNADWTLDEDSCGTAQRYPTPDQANITSSTAETYWSGAFSAMGVDLVKKGFHVESLPAGGRITFGDATNAQDLANYDVFVIPEPNVAFTSSEITAIRNFVQNGGGLFMISDHAGEARASSGSCSTPTPPIGPGAGSTIIRMTTTPPTPAHRSSGPAPTACRPPAAGSVYSARRR